MARILVTGASGFIGGHLVEALVRRGDQVRCLVRPTSRTDHLRGLRVEFACTDLTDLQGLKRTVQGLDVVFHLAGLTTALHSRDMMRVNGEGVLHVARACAACQTPPIHVLVSSVAAAGPTTRRGRRRESDRPAPVSHYGRSKRAGELAAQQWAHVVPTTIVRPGIVFGPRGHDLLPVFRTIYRIGIHLTASFAPPPLSLIHVEDLVEILVSSASSGPRLVPQATDSTFSGHGCVFACANEYPTYADLGRMISAALGRRHVFVLGLAMPLPWLFGGMGQILSLLLGQPSHLTIDKMREAMADSWACSTEAVRELLHFEPPRLLQARLKETADWYLEHGWL